MDRLDDTLDTSDGLGQWVPERLRGEGSRAISGDAFARAVVPFLRHAAPGQEHRGAVPVNTLLGCSWKKRTPPKTHAAAASLEAFFLNEDRSLRESEQSAQVDHYPALGLSIAHEGKNRVRFLRDRGVLAMPAAVRNMEYVSFDRITLHHAPCGGGDHELWAVLDGRYAQRMEYASLTMPLLRAAGLSAVTSWPEQLPAIARVRELHQSRGCMSAEDVDLASLVAEMEREVAGRELVAASIIDLDDVRFDKRAVAILLGGLALVAGAAVLVDATWTPDALWGCVGALCAAGAIFNARLLKVPGTLARSLARKPDDERAH